ncbi:OCIA domain-containing protein 1 [Echinococcus granulosus]|nr:OCIA domain-containing protein 1 [Echinococcus granulosus]
MMRGLEGSPPELTIEDMATFRRCRKESFWRRCVPMIMGASLAVSFAQSRGFFNNRPRLVMPSYLIAGVIGYVGGKISYIDRCKRMFLELQDSRVKDFLLGHQPSLPLPRRPDFSIEHDWPRSEGDPLVVRTPTTYAERREYYRQQEQRRRAEGLRDSSTPSAPPDDQKKVQESSQQQVSSKSSSSEYFDTERPLSSFLSDDEYRPRD